LVLQHILTNVRQPGSYSLALQWLYSLFVAYSNADIRAEHETAASAHVNAPQVSMWQASTYSCIPHSAMQAQRVLQLMLCGSMSSQ